MREGRKGNTGGPAGSTWGEPTTTSCYREGCSGSKRPWGLSKVTEQVGQHLKPLWTPSSGQLCFRGAGPDSWLWEVTWVSSEIMGCKNTEPCRSPGAKVPRGGAAAQMGWEGPALEGWDAGRLRPLLCDLGHLAAPL